jgi:ribosomal protein S18 acetylase RimI-like enzyme
MCVAKAAIAGDVTAAPSVEFRPWQPEDVAFLWEMLYVSIHVRDGQEPPPRSILDEPALAHYLSEFGSHAGDDAQIAVDDTGLHVGAAFCRRMDADDPGRGFVDADIPEVGMAVIAGMRGRGIGRRLLLDLLERHPVMSLSVDKDNLGAIGLYESLGFVTVAEEGTAFTMLHRPTT